MKETLFALMLIMSIPACKEEMAAETDLSALLAGSADTGFLRAIHPREFSFPADHAAHTGFRNEWWYFSGNLESVKGHKFGYQLTFFRIALSSEMPERQSEWVGTHMWMAHIALSDITNRQHYHDQRFSREAVNLSGVETDPLRIWLEDWRLATSPNTLFPWHITAGNDRFVFNLSLEPEKLPVLQGEQGLSRKGEEAGNASYYYSITRLRTQGEIELNGVNHKVKGQSWLDREWSTSVLSPQQAGWDWFSLQLDDGRDLMFYRIRRKSGKVDPHSAGSIVAADGSASALSADQVDLEVLDSWRSSSGKDYPVVWRMRIDGEPRDWKIQAAFNDQEMSTGINYWEGAVVLYDNLSGEVLGQGYLEMTGY